MQIGIAPRTWRAPRADRTGRPAENRNQCASIYCSAFRPCCLPHCCGKSGRRPDDVSSTEEPSALSGLMAALLAISLWQVGRLVDRGEGQAPRSICCSEPGFVHCREKPTRSPGPGPTPGRSRAFS